MRFMERKQKLEYLLEMIEKGRCISLAQAARQFDCSKRMIRRMIAELKEDGYDIRYCPLRHRFFKK